MPGARGGERPLCGPTDGGPLLCRRTGQSDSAFTSTFMAFSRRFYPKCLICQKEKQYTAVGKVRMFIEPSAKH